MYKIIIPKLWTGDRLWSQVFVEKKSKPRRLTRSERVARVKRQRRDQIIINK